MLFRVRFLSHFSPFYHYYTNTGRTKSVKWRKTQLKALQRFLEDNSDLLVKALDSDLRKNRQESLLFDIEFAVNDVKGAIMELHNWVKPEPATRCLMAVMDTPYIWNEPYGVCLIMGAWNYPVQLLISPAVGAIAAGNAVVFKVGFAYPPATTSLPYPTIMTLLIDSMIWLLT